MGRDKSSLTLEGRTFLEIQIEKGRRLGVRDILVSGFPGAGRRIPVSINPDMPLLPDTPSIPDIPILPDTPPIPAAPPFADIRVIPDKIPGQGPLGGLSTCLRFARHGRCLVLGVDVPLIPPEELSNLITCSLTSRAPAVILKHGEKEEPLIGIYRTSLAPAMEKALEEGSGSVFLFLRKTGYETYSSPAPERCFSNINDMNDYRSLINQG